MELVLKHVGSALLLLFGSFVIVANWLMFIEGVRGKRSGSMVWWFGGAFAACGLGLAPWLTNKTWALLPLLLDVTCAPMLVILPTMLLWRRFHRHDDPGEIQ